MLGEQQIVSSLEFFSLASQKRDPLEIGRHKHGWEVTSFLKIIAQLGEIIKRNGHKPVMLGVKIHVAGSYKEPLDRVGKVRERLLFNPESVEIGVFQTVAQTVQSGHHGEQWKSPEYKVAPPIATSVG
jgi:hypothetical protein